MDLFLVGVSPLLGREGIVGGLGSLADVAGESHGGESGRVVIEDSEHVLDERLNLIPLPLLLLVEMLELSNYVHDILEPLFQNLLLLLQLGN